MEYTWKIEEGVKARLHLKIWTDGRASLNGAIVDKSEGRPHVLIAAKNDSAPAASCADTDGSGFGGLVELTASVWDVHTKQYVPLVIRSANDMDEDGLYPISLQIGDDRVDTQARVKVKFHWDRE